MCVEENWNPKMSEINLEQQLCDLNEKLFFKSNM